MQQQPEVLATAAPPQVSGTGPSAEATTRAAESIDIAASRSECSAVVMVHIRRNRIGVVASLDMGGLHTVARVWTRDPRGGWATRDAEFIAEEDRIGVELAEYLDALDLPTRIADMLPRPPTAAGVAAMAEAEKEVRRA